MFYNFTKQRQREKWDFWGHEAPASSKEELKPVFHAGTQKWFMNAEKSMTEPEKKFFEC